MTNISYAQKSKNCEIIRRISNKYCENLKYYTKLEYCLINICVGKADKTLPVIEIERNGKQQKVYYRKTKVFSSIKEAKEYAAKYNILDVKLE